MNAGDRVRVVSPVDEAEAGTEGVVIGFYRRPSGNAVAVSTGVGTIVIPAETIEVVEACDFEQ